MTWYNPIQLEKVAQDIHEVDRCEYEAAAEIDIPAWEHISDERRQKCRDRAKAELDSLVPLDISKPLAMRNGIPVENPRLDQDGLRIVVDVPAWGRSASWGITGREVDQETDPMPGDLVHRQAA